MELKIGKFFSTITGKSESKIPTIKKQSTNGLREYVMFALGQQSIQNKLNLDSYKSVSADFDKESNSILIKVSF